MWAAFAWIVVPSGVLLLAMLASGWAPAMRGASKLIGAPVRMGKFELSVASIFTALCGISALLSQSALRRSEALLAGIDSTMQTVHQDALTRNVFYHGRNFWLSMCALILWSLTWRLKALYGRGQLSPPTGRGQARPLSRLKWLMVSLVALALGDIPLCRTNYNFQLSMFVTPKKERLLARAGRCEGAMLDSATGECEDFCAKARELSEDRLKSIEWARYWHIFGRKAAELFDEHRDVQQGQARIQALFKKKTCAEVARSADKSNQMVNIACISCAIVSGIFALTAISEAASSGPDEVAVGVPGAPTNVGTHPHTD